MLHRGNLLFWPHRGPFLQLFFTWDILHKLKRKVSKPDVNSTPTVSWLPLPINLDFRFQVLTATTFPTWSVIFTSTGNRLASAASSPLMGGREPPFGHSGPSTRSLPWRAKETWTTILPMIVLLEVEPGYEMDFSRIERLDADDIATSALFK